MPDPVRVVILLMAAGASSRMRGADKLLQVIDGETLLHRQAARACATGNPVIVTLPPDGVLRQAALAGLPVTAVPVPDARLGMAASLRAGVTAAAGLPGRAAGLMVVPADMPDLTTADLAALIAAFGGAPDRIWRGAAADGTPGHPAIFPRAMWPALAAVTGDRGGIDVIRAAGDGVRLCPLPGRAALTDLDTPEDWAAWRAQRPG